MHPDITLVLGFLLQISFIAQNVVGSSPTLRNNPQVAQLVEHPNKHREAC